MSLDQEIADPEELLLRFGEPVEDEDFLHDLRYRLWSELLNRPTKTLQFPGSQPVSFTRPHLQVLEREDYYVCEKSDGVRYLLYYTAPYQTGTAFLIDRNFQCQEIPGLTLPTRKAGVIHEETLLDGELIYEKIREPEESTEEAKERVGDEELASKDDLRSNTLETLDDTRARTTGQPSFRFVFLVFDALLINGQNVMGRSLPDRLKCVQNDVVVPFKEMMSSKDAPLYPFTLDMKKMWKSYAIAEILELEIPRLQHGNDGLIFTPVADPYVSGTCDRLLKWKPSELNSVDFKLAIHCDDKVSGSPNRLYELQVATREGNHRHFAFYEEPDAGVKLKDLDGAIIECRYDAGKWIFLRVRKDKAMANNERVVKKIIDSISDNVTSSELIAHIPAIRRAWRAREQRQATPDERPPTKRTKL